MKQTLQGKAYNWLLDRILNRTYVSGDALKEELIAREINISATPVREALRRLEREGLVENIPYRGCFLKKYTLEQFQEITILREILEDTAIYFIIANINEEDWGILNENIRNSEILVDDIENKNGDLKTFNNRAAQLDDEFHNILIKSSHSEKLIEMSALWNFQIQSFAFQNYHKPDLCQCITCGKSKFYWVVQQHRAIYTAIRSGWEQAAKELMRAHISTRLTEVISKAREQQKVEIKKRKKRS